MINIQITQNSEKIKQAQKIREEVFVKGQSVPVELEIDGLDESSEHALIYFDNSLVGCARIRYKNNKMRLERIAVLEEMRGKGFGTELMRHIIEYAKTQPVTEIYMHAQYYLLKYYQRLGFKCRGEIFFEADIKHIEMYMKLPN